MVRIAQPSFTIHQMMSNPGQLLYCSRTTKFKEIRHLKMCLTPMQAYLVFQSTKSKIGGGGQTLKFRHQKTQVSGFFCESTPLHNLQISLSNILEKAFMLNISMGPPFFFFSGKLFAFFNFLAAVSKLSKTKKGFSLLEKDRKSVV